MNASPTSLNVVINWLGFVTTIPNRVALQSNAQYFVNLPLNNQATSTSSYTANSLINVVPESD